MVALRPVSLGAVGNRPASFGVLLTMTSFAEFLVVLKESFPDPDGLVNEFKQGLCSDVPRSDTSKT